MISKRPGKTRQKTGQNTAKDRAKDRAKHGKRPGETRQKIFGKKTKKSHLSCGMLGHHVAKVFLGNLAAVLLHSLLISRL